MEKVVATEEGQYKHIVFQNLDEGDDSFLRYITTSVCPNWEGYVPITGDSGFVTCPVCTSWEILLQKANLTKDYYAYDNCYFLSFVKNEIVQNQQKRI